MTALAQKVRIQLRVQTLDADGNVLQSPAWVDEEWTVEMHRRQDVRVQENNVALSAVITTGNINDGTTTPSLVLMLSDREIFVDPNNLGTATANQPYCDIFLVARRDGGDCQVDSLDLLNPAGALANANDANVVVFSAGDNT